jgi:ribonuclease HII
MPWVVGIDEAGYGPNLGPLVQACAGLYLPDDDLTGWQTLKSVVRRMNEPKDDRLVIDDSKVVYTKGGLEELERTVLAVAMTMGISQNQPPLSKHLFEVACPESTQHREEYWYRDDSQLFKNDSNHVHILDRMNRWLDWIGKESCGSYVFHCRVVMPAEFNHEADASGSKATVLANGIIRFLRQAVDASRDGNVSYGPFNHSPVHITCDKLGGRNFYAPILQEAFPDGWPVAEIESAAVSRYRILNLGLDVTVTFKPRADGENVCVALASMLAKYVREVCMRQFNEFWAKHVPGIRPTAGYPVDAKRFYSEIQEAMIRLGIPADAVWRKK